MFAFVIEYGTNVIKLPDLLTKGEVLYYEENIQVVFKFTYDDCYVF